MSDKTNIGNLADVVTALRSQRYNALESAKSSLSEFIFPGRDIKFIGHEIMPSFYEENKFNILVNVGLSELQIDNDMIEATDLNIPGAPFFNIITVHYTPAKLAKFQELCLNTAKYLSNGDGTALIPAVKESDIVIDGNVVAIWDPKLKCYSGSAAHNFLSLLRDKGFVSITADDIAIYSREDILSSNMDLAIETKGKDQVNFLSDIIFPEVEEGEEVDLRDAENIKTMGIVISHITTAQCTSMSGEMSALLAGTVKLNLNRYPCASKARSIYDESISLKAKDPGAYNPYAFEGNFFSLKNLITIISHKDNEELLNIFKENITAAVKNPLNWAYTIVTEDVNTNSADE